jgi:hypothetical protein
VVGAVLLVGWNWEQQGDVVEQPQVLNFLAHNYNLDSKQKPFVH